jgi:hypothetical protein
MGVPAGGGSARGSTRGPRERYGVDAGLMAQSDRRAWQPADARKGTPKAYRPLALGDRLELIAFDAELAGVPEEVLETLREAIHSLSETSYPDCRLAGARLSSVLRLLI